MVTGPVLAVPKRAGKRLRVQSVDRTSTDKTGWERRDESLTSIEHIRDIILHYCPALLLPSLPLHPQGLKLGGSANRCDTQTREPWVPLSSTHF